MAGLPDPNVVKNLRNRGRVLDEAIESSTEGKQHEVKETKAKETQEAKESAGMPKPSLLTRVLKSITGK